MTIDSINDLRIVYEIIKIFNELVKEYGIDYKLALKRNEYLKELKQKAREYTHKKSDRRIINFDYDGYLELIELPEEIKSKENAMDYFEEWECIHYRPSQYDCTGQKFIEWFKVFKRRNRWMAYHRVGIDV